MFDNNVFLKDTCKNVVEDGKVIRDMITLVKAL